MAVRRSILATPADYRGLIRKVEQRRRCAYVCAGMFDSLDIPTYESALDVPQLGVARTGQTILENTYLILPSGKPVRARPVHLNAGGTRYAVDQLLNPESVVFTPAGLYNGNVLVVGEIASEYRGPESLAIVRLWSQFLRAQFTRTGSFWIGPEALEMARAGAEITQDARNPGSIDIVIP